jgi:tetratricopeptide (TPR) repeat protein
MLDPYHRAMQHYSANQYGEALAVLSPLLDRPHADVEALNLAAGCAYAMNRVDLAEAYWQRAVADHPQHPGVHNNLGNLYEQLKRFPEAEAMFRRSLDLKPDFAEAHYNLGNVLALQERIADAEQSLRRALELRPDFASAHYSLGKLLMKQARPEEARECFGLAIYNRPNWADAHFGLGSALAALQRREEAERTYRAAIELNPRLASAYQGLAEILETDGRDAGLEDVYRRLADQLPELSGAHYNLGQVIYRTTALAGFERIDEAEAAYRRAIEVQPDYLPAYIALGNLLKEDPARADEMLATFRRAVELDPDSAEARLNLGGALLRVGAYAEGWPLMESRYDTSERQRPMFPPSFPFPRWQGEPLAGKSILVLHEQGFGDTFQFCRYLPMLKSQGLTTLSFASPLAPALLSSIDGVDICIGGDAIDSLAHHDYWCLLMSLPALLGTTYDTVPNVTPYIAADEERIAHWRSRLPAQVPKIGFAAMAEPRPSVFDARRWISAQACVPLLGVSGVRFVNLQKAPVARAQLDTLPPHFRPLDLMDDVQDFADTAAIIASLDLVIAVDTSVAHLAGALGKPVWMLLPSNPCWRWLIDGEESVWYPKARLFRQTKPSQWDDVIARVADALGRWRDGN